MEKNFAGFCAAACAVLSFCFGGADRLLLALISMMALDYISGVVCAAVRRRLSSRVGFCGIAKKMLILLIVAAANLCDSYIICGGSALRSAAIGFYAANEAVSLLENAAMLGIPLPRRLSGALSRLRDAENVENKEEKPCSPLKEE